LTNTEGLVAGYTQTNENGYFKFNNLNFQSYYLNADILNSNILNDNPLLINFGENSLVDISQEESSLVLLSITKIGEPLCSLPKK